MVCGRGGKHLLYRMFLGNWPDILRVRVVVAKPGVRYKRDGAHAWRPFDQELARILVHRQAGELEGVFDFQDIHRKLRQPTGNAKANEERGQCSDYQEFSDCNFLLELYLC